jgi:hypothetical protein
MAQRRTKSVIWPPAGLSDALDGTADFPGACSLLQNLMPAQNQGGMFIARPAAQEVATLPDYGGGPLTCLATIGNMAYGMYVSLAFAGKDRPFAYNMATGAFLPIAGMTSANLPTSQPQTGDWTPPTADQIATRIVFTHPGFAGGDSNAPYYNVLTGNTTNGQPQITGIPSSAVDFLDTGMQLFGPGIPSNATIASVSAPSVTVAATGTAGDNHFTVTNATGLSIGQLALGPGLGLSFITNIVGTTITISGTLLANLSSTLVTFFGAVVTMSANASATANGVAITAVSAMSFKFGWLDVSNFSLATQANTANGIPALSGNPTITGVQPGMTITGASIPANTLVLGSDLTVVQASCSFTSGQSQVTVVGTPGNAGIFAGMTVGGAGVLLGTTVTDVSGSTVTLNQDITGTSPVTLTFAGAIMTLSQAATATAMGVSVTIAGGSSANPLWGAGDTNINPLPNVPVFARQFGNRSYFGVNTTDPPTSAVVASDPTLACQVTFLGGQTLTFADTIPVTAAIGLALFNQLGGIIQSLMVFQGASNIRQITGDPALGTWGANSLLTATGTLAPNSLTPTPKGVLFAAPDGLRLIDFDARVSDPIGVRGMGVVTPFANAVASSRMSAAYNENVYRITITWQPAPLLRLIYGSAQRTDEFWFHLDIGKFSGPHTSTTNQIEAWQANNSFIGDLSGGEGRLWRSDTYQSVASAYAENGSLLGFTLRTVLQPDDESLNANSLVEGSVFASMSAATQWLASAIDDQGVTLDQTYVWLGPDVTQSQLPIYWQNPIVFRQMAFQVEGNSEPQTLIGNIGLRYQKLGYPITYRPVPEFVLGQSILGGTDGLGP